MHRKVQTCTENCLHLSALLCALLLPVLFCHWLYLHAMKAVGSSTGSHCSKPLLRTQINHKYQITSYSRLMSMQVECTGGKPPSLIKRVLLLVQKCTERCRNVQKSAEKYRNVQKNAQKHADMYRKV